MALLASLEGALRLLHPFMPFVTEELWQRLPNRSGRSIMLAPFPGPGPRDLEAVCREIEPEYANWDTVQQKAFRRAIEMVINADPSAHSSAQVIPTQPT